MKTTTQSLTAQEILDRILNSKGQFVKAVWKSNPTPAAAHKKSGITLEKHTSAVCRAGINFANLSSVQQGIEEGTRGDVQELPWGQWKVDSEGNSLFPYIIEHTDKTGNYCEYVRLYPTDTHCNTIYYVNGEEVSKEKFAEYLTPSDAKKIIEPSDEDRPLCFTIKKDNILATEDFGNV
jgi:hypothetical protein